MRAIGLAPVFSKHGVFPSKPGGYQRACSGLPPITLVRSSPGVVLQSRPMCVPASIMCFRLSGKKTGLGSVYATSKSLGKC